jgi:DNA-binding transcriptional LysR family regulator
MKFDFNKARTFVEVVDSGGITLAANRLLRTQQAISLQLQQLEVEIECSLFDRQGPKITLTEDGALLYEQFKSHLFAMENAVLQLKSGKQHAGGMITIGAWMEQAVSYLPEMMRIFSQRFPLVEFKLIVANDVEIEQLLKTNKIDIGFQVYCQDKKMFKCEPVYRQPMLPVISRRYLKNNKAPKSIAETLIMPVLDYDDEYSAYNSWVKKNSKELLPQARKKIRTVTTSNNVVLKNMVLQGLGLAFLHQESIQLELESGELTPLLTKPKSKNIHVEIDLVHKRKHTFAYVQKEFIKFIHDNRDNWMVSEKRP